MVDVDGEYDGLTILLSLLLVSIDNQPIAHGILRHLLCNIIRQSIQMANTLPSCKAKGLPIMRFGVIAFKNWFGQNLTVNQVF